MVKKSLDIDLRYGKLDLESLHLRVYANEFFATNEDLSSLLGYVIKLFDSTDRFNIQDFARRK